MVSSDNDAITRALGVLRDLIKAEQDSIKQLESELKQKREKLQQLSNEIGQAQNECIVQTTTFSLPSCAIPPHIYTSAASVATVTGDFTAAEQIVVPEPLNEYIPPPPNNLTEEK